MANKIAKLKQDCTEVKGKLDDLKTAVPCDLKSLSKLLDDLQDAVDILGEDLKDHIETIENFICDVR